MIDSHRLGGFRCEEAPAKKSAQRKASDGVLHHQITTKLQDPGSNLQEAGVYIESESH
jgi:hypothetical protein